MFVSGNGRIEAQEVDIAAKLPGRILEILQKRETRLAEERFW